MTVKRIDGWKCETIIDEYMKDAEFRSEMRKANFIMSLTEMFYRILNIFKGGQMPKKTKKSDGGKMRRKGKTKKSDSPEIKKMALSKGAAVQVPDQIIIHAMGEYIGGVHAVDFLKNIGLSAHAFVTPDGKIIRSRHDHQGAYHAKGYNTNSLGVEFLVKGDYNYYTFLDAIQKSYLTNIQYRAGVFLIKRWLSKFNIAQISTHRYLSPVRKFDPGPGFPLKAFEKDTGVLIHDMCRTIKDGNKV